MKPEDVCILVVDDEPMILEILNDLFTAFQFQVDTAICGNEAWELVQQKSYNLVLTDIRMPSGDGIELTKKIKAHHPSHPSVLFMSGFSDLLNEEIYHIGAEGKFTKPFDAKAVRQAIQLCLLAPEAKWAQPFATPATPILNIEKRGASVALLESEKSVLFGRGGLFISHAFTPPERGSTVSFSIEIQKPNHVILKGLGLVRWIQKHGKSNIPPGLGIEIIHLAPAEAKVYHELFGKLIPFIPSVARVMNE
ncbi:MAG: response regulator [Bdellovibrio sp.]|nr:response regulator [Bdellovibrio sp.]